MISLKKLRQIDPGLADLSDDEIFEVRAKLYALGQLAFDSWAVEKSAAKPISRYPLGTVAHQSDSNTM